MAIGPLHSAISYTTARNAWLRLIEGVKPRAYFDGLVLPIAAGMQVSAEIIQGTRTVLEYLLWPVQRVTSEAAIGR